MGAWSAGEHSSAEREKMDHSPHGEVSPNLPHSFEHPAVPPPWSAQAEADF